MLCNLEHRGAVGADPKAGDGSGILIQLPHNFLKKELNHLNYPIKMCMLSEFSLSKKNEQLKIRF